MLIAVMVITLVAVIGTSVAVMANRSTKAAGDAQTAGVVKDLGMPDSPRESRTCVRSVSRCDRHPGRPYLPLRHVRSRTSTPTTPEWTRSKPRA